MCNGYLTWAHAKLNGGINKKQGCCMRLCEMASFFAFCGALRKGPPFHGSRSSREIKIQNASCQMGGREVTR